jgi:integrator complex subunit 11
MKYRFKNLVSMSIRIIPLGAGQEVGRSCIVVQIEGKVVMFDCGLHMGFQDHRRFPDFSQLLRKQLVVDVIVVSHFHMDHIGGLVHFCEVVGFNGPIVMTVPTRAIARLQFEDAYKISPQNGSLQQIEACLQKVVTIQLHQSLIVAGIELTPYYAGHVLGAAMFEARVGNHSVFYTGDFNTTPDRHLGPAETPRIRCDVLITETTYATTMRDSKRVRESDFIDIVSRTVRDGGKVLIPVFALGRAQELCLLLDTYWERAKLGYVPLMFASPMVERANAYYRMFVEWTSDYLRKKHVWEGLSGFQYSFVRSMVPEDQRIIDSPGPCVVFATPGMLHTGYSLELFTKWCSDHRNTVIIPGYCVEGTAGHRILNRRSDEVDIGGRKLVVKCQVRALSFSAHADCRGCLNLIRNVEPAAVVCVHGESSKMHQFRRKVEDELCIACHTPANGVIIEVPVKAQQHPTVQPHVVVVDESGEKKFSTSWMTKNDSATRIHVTRSLHRIENHEGLAREVLACLQFNTPSLHWKLESRAEKGDIATWHIRSSVVDVECEYTSSSLVTRWGIASENVGTLVYSTVDAIVALRENADDARDIPRDLFQCMCLDDCY